MHVKPIHLVISSFVVGAGILAGWFDLRSARVEPARDTDSSAEGSALPIPTVPGAVPGREKNRLPRGDDTRGNPTPAAPAPGEEPPLPGPIPSSLSDESLEEARRLVDEARDIYGDSIGKDGSEKALRNAYDKLRRSQDILSRLPSTRDSRDLDRQVGLLLFDVGRSLPFDG